MESPNTGAFAPLYVILVELQQLRIDTVRGLYEPTRYSAETALLLRVQALAYLRARNQAQHPIDELIGCRLVV